MTTFIWIFPSVYCRMSAYFKGEHLVLSVRNEILKSLLAVVLSVIFVYVCSLICKVPYTITALFYSVVTPMVILPFFVIPNFMQKKKIINTNKILTELVDERNMLLYEVHHRVKNNLSIILSLLHLQHQKSFYVQNPEYSLLNFERRIQTMSLVYDLILRSSDLATMNLRDFLHKQRDLIVDIAKNPYIHIDLVTEPENLTVCLKNAIPVGLIISEICTNAFQHAFPGRNTGKIIITAVRKELSTVLTIMDDGIGILSEEFSDFADTIGLLLVDALSEQVQGKYTLKNSSGTVFTLVYKSDST